MFFESSEGRSESNQYLFLKISKLKELYLTTELGIVAILELTYLPMSTNPCT
jgi:hypothetical protein